MSFSKMVHSKAIHFSLTWNFAVWKIADSQAVCCAGWKMVENNKGQVCRSDRTFSQVAEICQVSIGACKPVPGDIYI